jgi:hypothetical protein
MIASARPTLQPPRAMPRLSGPNFGATSLPRFTLDGSAALERHLAETCERIAAGLRGLVPANRLLGVVLAGGYGRGEGGVLRTPTGDLPYNDLEFYLFLRGNRHLNEMRYGRALHVLGEILTPQAGLDVEFRIASLPEFEAAGVSMFSYDLICGHRWLIGDDHVLANCSHHRNAEDIPIEEATRLMMNRCTGLLLAAERLAKRDFTPGDADFTARNIAKAQLGAGDAMLTVFAQYHWSVRERHRVLERLARTDSTPWMQDLARHHAAGVEFKLHPTRSTASREQLATLHAEVTAFCQATWLRLEQHRLRRPFASIDEYVAIPRKWPKSSRVRNALVNLKQFGPRTLLSQRLQHPRERVLTALPLLLWQRDALDRPAGLTRLQTILQTDARDFSSLVRAYRAIWERVN